MARSFNGSSQYCTSTLSFGSATPWTVACWALCANATSEGYAFGPSKITQFPASLDILGFRGDVANDPVVDYLAAGGTTAVSDSGVNGFSANTWAHICGVTASATDHKVFLDGVERGTNSNSVSAIDATTFVQGCYYHDNTRSSYLNGKVMHCAAWDVALTAAEIASLARGFSPRRIRPQSLKFYDPGLRTLRSLIAGTTGHSDNASVADHHRCYGY